MAIVELERLLVNHPNEISAPAVTPHEGDSQLTGWWESNQTCDWKGPENVVVEAFAAEETVPDAAQWHHRFHGGWRTGLSFGTLGVLVVFLLNLAVLLWINVHFQVLNGVATVYEGSCTEMKSISTWCHLAINVLGTLLLSASNAAMQCLSSPTREEIDKAHARGTWLDIGVPSIRNLRAIDRRRVLLWTVLGLSSIPLHLLYNSVMFTTLATNDYLAVVVAENFLDGASWNRSEPYSFTEFYSSEIAALQNNLNDLEKLDNAACIRNFRNQYVSEWRYLLVVSNLQSNDSVYAARFHTAGELRDTSWICSGIKYGDDCDTSSLIASADQWQLVVSTCPGNDPSSGYCPTREDVTIPVKYCLAERTPSHCIVDISHSLLVVVLICNAFKLTCLISTLLLPNFKPFVTVGDGIASFLRNPDQTTSKKGPISAHEVYKKESRDVSLALRETWLRLSGSNYARTSGTWVSKRHWWFRAASYRRWVWGLILIMGLWLAALSLLLIGLRAIQYLQQASPWKVGIGVANVDALVNITIGTPFTVNVLVANSPQLFLSFVYLLYNGLFTCMLLGAEYNDFAVERKSLRVSAPIGLQRWTYYLQLPYRYAVPLTVASGGLHWLVSQSIFLVRIRSLGLDGAENADQAVIACGWSAIAILIVLVLGGLMILTLIGFGFRRYHAGMPIASSCSIAISAACHPLPNDKYAAFSRLMYGVVGTNESGVEHASFSSREVTPLVAGRQYE